LSPASSTSAPPRVAAATKSSRARSGRILHALVDIAWRARSDAAPTASVAGARRLPQPPLGRSETQALSRHSSTTWPVRHSSARPRTRFGPTSLAGSLPPPTRDPAPAAAVVITACAGSFSWLATSGWHLTHYYNHRSLRGRTCSPHVPVVAVGRIAARCSVADWLRPGLRRDSLPPRYRGGLAAAAVAVSATLVVARLARRRHPDYQRRRVGVSNLELPTR
jgi:hypothetical protein